MPLLPLRVVLFDGGRLPLQIFETRYLDMVSACMRRAQPFGVVLIRSGTDARLDQSAVGNVRVVARILDNAGRRGALFQSFQRQHE